MIYKTLLIVFLLNIYTNYSDINQDNSNQFEFIAMEYIGMKNHIYRVVVTDTHIVGLEVNGYISVSNKLNIGTTINKDSLANPEAYVDKMMDIKYDNIDVDSADILKMNPKNFRILRSQIESVNLSNKKKFGMGYYPYSGRVIIKSEKTLENRKKKRDLILVGNQDEQMILEKIKINSDRQH